VSRARRAAPAGRITVSDFVVVSGQRCGSTLLVKSLDSSPEIFCAGEIFHPGARTLHREYQFPDLRRDAGLASRILARPLRSRRVERHLENFYRAAGSGVRAVGFKLMISQAEKYRAILPWLKGRKVRVICLYRRNAFDAAMSYALAARTGQFHSDRPSGDPGPEGLMLDAEDFAGYFRHCASDRARILDVHRMLGGVLLSYEELIRDWDMWIDRIGAHVGVERLSVPMILEKLGAESRPRIANEDELRQRFADPGAPA
jgi:LPS sulfotransferase NodH